VPLAFSCLGFATASVRRLTSRLGHEDARRLLLPLLSLSCFLLLLLDLDNILLFLLKGVLIPLAALRAFVRLEPPVVVPMELSR
jgi:hypothetical protein